MRVQSSVHDSCDSQTGSSLLRVEQHTYDPDDHELYRLLVLVLTAHVHARLSHPVTRCWYAGYGNQRNAADVEWYQTYLVHACFVARHRLVRP